MARQARVKSESGIYHVMLRGVNKQQIFFDEQDYKKFIQVLIDCKRVSKFELYAYCLMDNHVHLLIKENDENISVVMKRIGCRFVYWYNAKYKRVGHLFQDRFKSEPVQTDEYLLCVLRYIHKNPVKAGIVRNCTDYPYSSYNWYYKKGILIDEDFVLSMINKEQFAEFHQEKDKQSYLDISETRTVLTNEIALEIIKSIAQVDDAEDIKKMENGLYEIVDTSDHTVLYN